MDNEIEAVEIHARVCRGQACRKGLDDGGRLGSGLGSNPEP